MRRSFVGFRQLQRWSDERRGFRYCRSICTECRKRVWAPDEERRVVMSVEGVRARAAEDYVLMRWENKATVNLSSVG